LRWTGNITLSLIAVVTSTTLSHHHSTDLVTGEFGTLAAS
jgi:hypothetical protein